MSAPLLRELAQSVADSEDAGSRSPLTTAVLHMGYDSWGDVVTDARAGDPVAIELLCRRVERAL